MYSERIEALINAALIDGKLTEKEKQILYKNAEAEGIDLDEFEMILDARLMELEKESTNFSPKSNKMGEIRRCPACGVLVNSFQRRCSECGYIFENIATNPSIVQLSNRLQKTNDYEKRRSIVLSFPIPSTKNDLVELITVLHPMVYGTDGRIVHTIKSFDKDSDDYKPYTDDEGSHSPSRSKSADMAAYEADAYLSKYRECIEKIKLFFPNDEMLSPYVDEFEKALKQKVRQEERETIFEGILGCITVIFFVLLFVFAKKCEHEPTLEERLQQKVEQQMEKNAEKQLELSGKIWDWLLEQFSPDESSSLATD